MRTRFDITVTVNELPNLALLLSGPSRSAALLVALAGRILLKGPAAERTR
jgi:hypothetical protein